MICLFLVVSVFAVDSKWSYKECEKLLDKKIFFMGSWKF